MRGGRPTPAKQWASTEGVSRGTSRALVTVDRRLPVARVTELRMKATRLLARMCLRAILIVAVVAGLGFAGLQARLSHSPISMSFLVPPIEKAVKGMLPKNVLGRQMLSKLKVYSGAEHPHQAQKPQVLTTPATPARA